MATDRCELTDLPREMCAHCKGVEAEDPTVDYRLEGVFTAKYNGTCGIDDDHGIVKGDEISRVMPTDNPFSDVVFACSRCTKKLTRRRHQEFTRD